MRNCFVFRVCFGTLPKAFSLVEMLMALLVASLLLAALAPVMTRRMPENVNVSGVGGSPVTPKVYCAYSNDKTTTMILDTKEKGCIVPDNTYSANAIIASGGGGGGGAVNIVKSTNFINLITTGGNASSETTGKITFDRYAKDLTVKIIGAGAGGGGGNYTTTYFSNPTKQYDCEPFGVYVSSTYNGGSSICVSKYNPGDIYYTPSYSNKYASPAIPSGINIYNTDGQSGSSSLCSANNCCWKPSNYSYALGDTKACDTFGQGYLSSGFGGMKYSACHRTVCQWEAANTICSNWKPVNNTAGRLPTKDEVTAWKNSGNLADTTTGPGSLNWNASVSAGLQLCGGNANTKYKFSPKCTHNFVLRCKGAEPSSADNKSKCWPNRVWASTSANTANTTHYYLNYNAGTFSISSGANKSAGSVRCVVDKTFVFKSYTGGGGGAGAYAQVKVPESVALKATEYGNGIIKTYAGKRGNGGGTSSAGSSGQRSLIEIFNSNNQLIWSLSVPGGNYGSRASTSSGGSAGGSKSANCTYFDLTDEQYSTQKTIACSSVPGIMAQAAGQSGSGGNGGGSYWGGSQGSRTSTATAGSAYGAGGGGGYHTESSTGSKTGYSGKAGAGGAVNVTYKLSYPGVGGGGGAAGTVLHIKNFQVRPKDLIKVKVGEKGRGGTVSVNGGNGGNSYIQLASGTKYEVLGGGGGKAGKAGNPNVTPGIMPIAGAGGTKSSVAADTKSKLSKKDEYYPIKDEDTKGGNAVETSDMIKSAGGNGGINSKISILAKAQGGTPCGGLNTNKIVFKNTNNEEVKWQCNNPENTPLPLSRTLSTTSFDIDIIHNFSAGSTGGGGGGWDNEAETAAATGADGMGGYVYIYFGEWETTQAP